VIPYSGEECLIWPFVRSPDGYGRIRIAPGKSKVASRYVCELVHGVAPTASHEAALLCGNGRKGCVNPKHLVWRSRAENIEIKVAEGRSAKGQKMPNSKLNEELVREIRRSYPASSISDLAKAHDVSRATIQGIVKRSRWSWVMD
jgi:hypothetical protein